MITEEFSALTAELLHTKIMRKGYQPSLRARLVRLVLLGVLPALGVILYDAGEQRLKDRRNVEREALRLAQIVAINQQRLIDSTRHLLIALSALTEVRALEGKGCGELFNKLLREYP